MSASDSRGSREGRVGHVIRLHLWRVLEHLIQRLEDTGIRAAGIHLSVFFRIPHTDADRVRSTGASAPQLKVSTTSLRSGQTLSGTIEDPANRQVELLLVDDDGQVHNLSRLLRPAGAGKAFRVRLDLSGTGSQPQLLLAIASTQPIDVLKQADAAKAAVVFPRVLDEAARSGLSLAVAAKHFRLEP